MSYEAALPATSLRGRRTKLTPERIEQIKELIASGVSCEDIAATVGVTVGTLKRRGLQGVNRVVFTGRIGRRALRPGSYRAIATAKDAAGNASAPSAASFTIAR